MYPVVAAVGPSFFTQTEFYGLERKGRLERRVSLRRFVAEVQQFARSKIQTGDPGFA